MEVAKSIPAVQFLMNLPHQKELLEYGILVSGARRLPVNCGKICLANLDGECCEKRDIYVWDIIYQEEQVLRTKRFLIWLLMKGIIGSFQAGIWSDNVQGKLHNLANYESDPKESQHVVCPETFLVGDNRTSAYTLESLRAYSIPQCELDEFAVFKIALWDNKTELYYILCFHLWRAHWEELKLIRLKYVNLDEWDNNTLKFGKEEEVRMFINDNGGGDIPTCIATTTLAGADSTTALTTGSTTPTEADSTGTAPDDAVTASSTTATTG